MIMSQTTFLAVLAATLLAGCSANESAISGEDLFVANCANCHGAYGDGTGPASTQVPQMVPDLRFIAAANEGVFPRELVRRIIDGREIDDAHSSDVMPKWGKVFGDGEKSLPGAEKRVALAIDALVDYVGEIQISDDD